MIKKISLSITFTSLLLAQNLPIEGQTWPFAEKNAIEEIKSVYSRDKDIVDARMKKAKEESLEKLKHYKAPNTVSLPRATKDNVFFPNMVYTLDRDLRNADGKLLYPKGFSFNIMDYTNLGMKIVIFDPTDKEQMEWFQKTSYAKSLTDMVLISDGEVFEVNKKITRPLYYLSKPIVDRFGLKHTPCIVEQEGNKIKVTELSTLSGVKK